MKRHFRQVEQAKTSRKETGPEEGSNQETHREEEKEQ